MEAAAAPTANALSVLFIFLVLQNNNIYINFGAFLFFPSRDSNILAFWVYVCLNEWVSYALVGMIVLPSQTGLVCVITWLVSRDIIEWHHRNPSKVILLCNREIKANTTSRHSLLPYTLGGITFQGSVSGYFKRAGSNLGPQSYTFTSSFNLVTVLLLWLTFTRRLYCL